MIRPALALAACLSSLWLVTAAAESPERETPDGAADDAADAGAAGHFTLRPSTRERQQIEADSETGDTVFIGTPLHTLLGQAHGVHPRDVQAVGVDLAQRFDVRVRPGPGAKQARVRSLLAAGLAKTLQLGIVRSEQRVPINRLRRRTGEPALSSSTIAKPEVDVAAGRFEARGLAIRDLILFLRWHSPRPILDETELDATYDFVLEWDPSSGTPALFLSLHDLGLEIVRGRDVFSFVVASKSSKLP